MYSRREEQFLDNLEAIVDSGGGMIRIGNMQRDLDDLEAEAALLYFDIASDIVDVSKAMGDYDYFKKIVMSGMKEMGMDDDFYESIKKDKKTMKTYKEFVNSFI